MCEVFVHRMSLAYLQLPRFVEGNVSESTKALCCAFHLLSKQRVPLNLVADLGNVQLLHLIILWLTSFGPLLNLQPPNSD